MKRFEIKNKRYLIKFSDGKLVRLEKIKAKFEID